MLGTIGGHTTSSQRTYNTYGTVRRDKSTRLSQDRTTQPNERHWQGSNRQPVDRQLNALPLRNLHVGEVSQNPESII